MSFKIGDDFLRAGFFFLPDLLVLAVEVLELLVILAGNKLKLLLDEVCLRVTLQVLLCLVIDELLIKLSLERLRH